MDLREFTKETILQIIRAVEDINNESNGKNAGHIITYNKKKQEQNGIEYAIIDVNFDVAITTIESEGAQGGAGLQVAIFSAGGKIDSKIENQSISRIRFSLPLVLPKEDSPISK